MIGQFTLIEVLNQIGRGTIQKENSNILIGESFVGPTKYFCKEDDGSWSLYEMKTIKFERKRPNMIGQYELEDLLHNIPGTIISGVKELIDGEITIKLGNTINYYKREYDGSWTNYDCKTTERILF